jgi:hypothetical protein
VEMPERGDRALAMLSAVTSAVLADLPEDRWRAAWRVLAAAVAFGTPDLAARAAMDLAAVRDPAWPAPPEVDAFVDVIALAGLDRRPA